MIKCFADRITNFLIRNNSVDSEDQDVCSYGMEILICSIINSIIILTLGIVLNKFLQTLVFIVCYCMIRQFAGGYHAKSHIKCIFTFILMYLSTVIMVENINSLYINSMIIIIIDIIICLSICILSPVENLNNPLNNTEKVKNKKGAKKRVNLVLLALIIFNIQNINYEYILYCSFALSWINFMLIMQILINNRGRKNEKNY